MPTGEDEGIVIAVYSGKARIIGTKETREAVEIPDHEEMEKIKPCPFCGSNNVFVTFEHGYLDDSAIVFCNACKISVKLEDNDQDGFNNITAKRAAEAWNKRMKRSEE